jgi:uncharacterized DUF497 family protein
MTHLSFTWDERKNRQNQKKHGVSFDEAQSVFFDDQAREFFDPEHSEDEERFVLIGYSHRGRILVIVHTDRGDRIRIISARQATRKERRHHEENAQ